MKIGIAGPISTECVAHLLHGPLPKLRGWAGAPFLGTLITTLLEHGHEVRAYTLDIGLSPHSPEATVAQGDRFRMYYLPNRRRAFCYSDGVFGRMSDFYRLERRALAKAMLNDPPDVIHAHWTYEFALAAIATGLPYVVTAHDSPVRVLRFMPNLYRLGRYLMARAVFHRATKLTVVSPYLRDEIRAFTNLDVNVIPNPMPPWPDMSSRPAVRAGRQLHAPRIAMINSGWDTRKNAKPALRAFQLVRHELPGASLHLFGGDFGPGERAEVWARQHGLADAVVFHGRTPYNRLMEALGKMEVFCHPALEECCCMTIVEAMSLGVPVVGGRESGGVPWQLGNGDSGVLVDVKSPSAIASGIVGLVADEGLYDNLSRRSVLRAEELFSRNTVARSYEHIYEEAINSVKSETAGRIGSHA